MTKDIPDSLRAIIFDEAGYQCPYCGHRDGLNLTIHHITPSEEGGLTNYSNLIALCHNCHHRIHESKTIKPKDIRRIKRYLVQKYFTPVGVNATRIAYQHPLKVVPVAPVEVQHLVEMGFFEFDEEMEHIGWQDKETGKEHPRLMTLAVYQLTSAGIDIAERWIIRSKD